MTGRFEGIIILCYYAIIGLRLKQILTRTSQNQKESTMSAKVKLIISDTHIGAGGARQGNKLEDFISDDVFYQWVHQLLDESNRTGVEMTLIINGDWIEFLQTPAVDAFDPTRPYPREAYTDVSAAMALKRLEVVHAGHPRVFQALADFISPGPPRRSLVILFGNHDPELAYPQVQERLRTLLGVHGSRSDVVHIGARSYFEDGIYVEHGNAYTEEVNRFTDPDHPFDPDAPELIERPPGSYFVTDFFNSVEWERPWIDGVHPASSLIFYALAYDPAFALRAIKTFLASAPDLVADMLATGEAEEGEQSLLAELESADEQALAQRLADDHAFAAAFSDEVARALMAKGAMPSGADGVLATGGVASPGPEVRAQEIAEQYWAMLEKAAARLSVEKNARVILHGHIHERIEKRLPSGALYLNTGTWIWKANFKDAPEEMWRDLIAHPEKYMNQRQLTYARVDIAPNGDIVAARLLLANEPPAPPAPPDPMPPSGLWPRFVLAVRSAAAWMTGWL